MEQLKQLIKEETNKLICQTHPKLCQLRDQNYQKLEAMIINEVLSKKHKEPPTIQTALATLEQE